MTETPSTPHSIDEERRMAAEVSAERRRRSMSTRPRDMIISMAVIVGFVLLLLLIVPRPNQIPERDIDVPSAALGARSELGFAPSTPSMPTGWTARAAGVQADQTDGLKAWHLTYTTPEGTYAGVQQAARATPAWESRQVTDGQEAGKESLGGIDWIIRSRQDRGITSLVYRATDGVTTIVTGTADGPEMNLIATAVARTLT